MNRYPWWINALVVVLVLVSLVVALPTLYGVDPGIQVTQSSGQPMTERELERARQALAGTDAEPVAAYIDGNQAILRFGTEDAQGAAFKSLQTALGEAFVVAQTFAPRAPGWLRALHLQPVARGLDLQGGVHFLFEVDMGSAVRQRMEAYSADFAKLLRDNRIRRSVQVVGREIQVRIPDAADLDRAEKLLKDSDPDLKFERRDTPEGAVIAATMTEAQVKARQDFAIQQNTTTLRNRINELGVAETVVQRQGLDRIVVQLPGVQDPAQAERVLGATATLQFRLVCEEGNPVDAEQSGRVPLGCELFKMRGGGPVLLKRRTIVTGDQLVDATQGFEQGQPAVFVRLDSKGARSMLDTTRENLNKPMAVVFVEQKRESIERNGEKIDITREERQVINVATIRGVFSSQFQITGLGSTEARDLALLLRAGALAAPIFKVEERTVGPSLGKDNIARGILAFEVGFALVAIFMVVYYRMFGLIANLALIANAVLILAVLALLHATLTLPGIAGIVLTIGMAVDANVLINERIREELRNGSTPQAAIHAGYDKAFATIADSNITTLIAGIMLFAFGNGPIKGFAVVLCIGILTSMFTAVVGTRAVINLIYGGGRKLQRLSV